MKKLLSVVLLASLVGVVSYAMVKPDPAPEATEQGGRRGGGGGVQGGSGGGAAPIVPVLAATVARTDVPVVLDGVGTVRPLNTVTIKPQVDGRILKIAFAEGQDIKAGDLLALIDPATYQAAFDQAAAKRAVTQTQLDNARRDYERMAKIPSVMAQKTMDTQQAQVDQFAAQLKADDAAVASTQTVLNYTRVVSPINGRTGLRLVDEANLVRAGDAGLVTITEIDPIAVVFTLPQQRLVEVQKALAKGAVAIEALDAEGRQVVETGTIEVIDNQIDSTTGTVKMKARFPNARRLLWPGQFVNVRVRVDTLDGVLAIPSAAVQRGPAGTFVWVVGADKEAVVRPVQLGLQTETVAVIARGLEPGEQVVTTGFARISEGAKLVVRDAPASAPATFAPPARAKGGKGEGGGGGEKGKRRRQQEGNPGGANSATPPAPSAPSGPTPSAAASSPDAPTKATP